MADQAAFRCGFTGKAITCGDFIARGLPPAVRAAWDDILGLIARESRAVLGAAWEDAWMEAPLWHFCLGAGVLSPDTVHGVLIPSLDRVGRLFPFSVLAACAPAGQPVRNWALQAEALACSALDDDFDPDALITTLGRLQQPELVLPGASAFGEVALPENPGDWPTLVDQSPTPPPGTTQWWCRGARLVTGVIATREGLPDAQFAARLVADHRDQNAA